MIVQVGKKRGMVLSFYRIPFGTTTEKEKHRRQLWVAAIRRDRWSEKKIDNARICSLHFISGIATYLN